MSLIQQTGRKDFSILEKHVEISIRAIVQGNILRITDTRTLCFQGNEESWCVYIVLKPAVNMSSIFCFGLLYIVATIANIALDSLIH